MGAAVNAKVVVVGGGPAGSTAAESLARKGVPVLLLDPMRERPKPCAGVVPPILLEEFRIPNDLVTYQSPDITFVAPSHETVECVSEIGPIPGISREKFDPYLRQRAVDTGAEILQGRCAGISEARNGYDLTVQTSEETQTIRAEIVLAADGAHSVIRESIGLSPPRQMRTYQERLVPPEGKTEWLDVPYTVHLDDRYSPDRYAWIFPKGDYMAVGTIWRDAGKPKQSIDSLKVAMGLDNWAINLCEASPVAYGLASKLAQDRVLLLGDAGGLAAPATGEGIYYAMKSGVLAAKTVLESAEVDRFAEYAARIHDHFGHLFKILLLLERLFFHSRSGRERLIALLKRDRLRGTALRGYLNKEWMGIGWWQWRQAVVRHSGSLFTR